MRWFLAAALVIGFLGQASKAFAYACNDNYYRNASTHLVHSPSCGLEDLRQEALCGDGSVSFSEHRRGTCSHHHGVAHWE
jgi:hypothetical protein